MKHLGSKRNQLILFFMLAFAIGWVGVLPALAGDGSLRYSAFLYLFSPAIAALVTAGMADGFAGMKEVLRRYLRWKTQPGWYLLALLLVPAIFLAAAALTFPSEMGTLWTNNPWYFLVASFAFLMVITSGEEIGWRGFALVRLQSVLGNPFLAGVVLGAIWGLWHAPVYLIPEQSQFPFYLFMLFITGLSVVYSVLFQNTGGSLLLAVLLHASTDLMPRVLQIDKFTLSSWNVIALLTWISALVCAWGFARSGRGNKRGVGIRPNEALPPTGAAPGA
jgi:membrane protease YdiL (CAAX protease family)